jgi:hypothetical protein
MVFLLFTVSGGPVEAGDGSSLIRTFESTENSIDKRNILKSLSQNEETQNSAVPRWKVDLITIGLADKSPVVVETAVKQVGKLGLTELSPRLIDHFKNADERFIGGYTDRVRIALFKALGKVGGPGVAELFQEFLENDNGSGLGGDALLAVKNLNDPSLLNTVKMYMLKMDARIAEKKKINADPIFYSRYLNYLELARDVKESLLKSKGGSQ